MKAKQRFLISFILIISVLLTGCSGLEGLFGTGLVPYAQMKYTRPDMVRFASVLEESCTAALEEQDIRKLERAILAFYDEYDAFYTNMNLSFISYSRDLTDIYWEAEYSYCASYSATADAGLDQLYRALAKSPLRETLEGEAYFGTDYFTAFEGEGIYDDYLTSLLNQEAQLCNEYQTIYGSSAASEYYSDEYFTQYGSQMAEVFLELVKLRQQIASYVGYESYVQFAYDFYYYRDYSPQQTISYLADIRAELVPLYRTMSATWEETPAVCTEEELFSYVEAMAKNMGGTVLKAFSAMSTAKVYDISYGVNKYGTSFEVYLSAYQTPYIFLCPTGTEYDKLAFAHEFGHFCSDYVVPGGSMYGADTAEIISQAMEYLSLHYAPEGEDLLSLKMATCLRTYVEQAALASFEHQVYELTGADLTLEGIQALYEEVCIAYGLDVPGWDSRDYVCIPHFYESPMYIMSYVVSNDVALQIYEMELLEQGSGLACLEKSFLSAQPDFLSFVEAVGLETPFATGRLMRVRQILETIYHDDKALICNANKGFVIDFVLFCAGITHGIFVLPIPRITNHIHQTLFGFPTQQ